MNATELKKRSASIPRERYSKLLSHYIADEKFPEDATIQEAEAINRACETLPRLVEKDKHVPALQSAVCTALLDVKEFSFGETVLLTKNLTKMMSRDMWKMLLENDSRATVIAFIQTAVQVPREDFAQEDIEKVEKDYNDFEEKKSGKSKSLKELESLLDSLIEELEKHK